MTTECNVDDRRGAVTFLCKGDDMRVCCKIVMQIERCAYRKFLETDEVKEYIS